MRHVRRGRIKAIYNLGNNYAEILEIEVSESSGVLNTPLRDIYFPDSVVVGAIVRDDKVLVPIGDDMIRAGDRVIILAANGKATKIEKMFSSQVDLF